MPIVVARRREIMILLKEAPSRACNPMEAERKIKKPAAIRPISIHRSHRSTGSDVLRYVRNSIYKKLGLVSKPYSLSAKAASAQTGNPKIRSIRIDDAEWVLKQ